MNELSKIIPSFDANNREHARMADHLYAECARLAEQLIQRADEHGGKNDWRPEELISYLTKDSPRWTFRIHEPVAQSLVAVNNTFLEEQIKWLSRHPHQIHGIQWDTFEEIIAEILRDKGFEIQITRKTRDGGFDAVGFYSPIIGVKTKFLIEAKRYREDRLIGVSIVDRLFGITFEQRAQGMLVTTSAFSRNVIKKKDRGISYWNLELIDYDLLKEWLRGYRQNLD